MEQSVAVLVQRAVDGDARAWAAIVDRYAPLVWSVSRRFGLSAQDTDDVAQAVWLRLIDNLPSLRVPEALPGWLVTTTRRECLRHVRSSQGRTRREIPLLEEVVTNKWSADADEDLIRAERHDALRAAFELLGERCRQLLGLLLRDPPPQYADIAKTLGLPVGSLGPTRARCLDSLRKTPQITALLAAEKG